MGITAEQGASAAGSMIEAGVGMAVSQANNIINQANLDFKKRMLRLDADDARDALFANEAKYRRSSGRLLASTVTNISKSGVRLEGSALKALQESSANAEINALEQRFNGLREIQKTKIQARQIDLQKRIQSLQSENQQTAMFISGAANSAKALLGGG